MLGVSSIGNSVIGRVIRSRLTIDSCWWSLVPGCTHALTSGVAAAMASLAVSVVVTVVTLSMSSPWVVVALRCVSVVIIIVIIIVAAVGLVVTTRSAFLSFLVLVILGAVVSTRNFFEPVVGDLVSRIHHTVEDAFH